MATELQAKEVAGAFNFPGQVAAAEAFGEGHINDTFRTAVQKGPETQWNIVQRINTHIFKNPAQLMENLVGVTEYLAQNYGGKAGAGAEFLRVIPTKDGASFYTAPGGEVWRANNFIAGGVSFQTGESPQLLAAAGRGFGRFARMLDSYPVNKLHETIPQFHDTRKRLADFVQAAQADEHGRAAGCQAEIDFVLARKADCTVLMDMLDTGELPLRVTHNDTKLNNVLINPNTLEPVCVIDLDTVMPGLIANDFGDAIRSGATTAAEDEQDLSRVNFSLPMYKTYAESYLAEVGAVLRPKETETLRWGAKLMTLECGMRFLADHLQGDVYFKTHREGHNLDRARTQFKLVQDMETAWDSLLL